MGILQYKTNNNDQTIYYVVVDVGFLLGNNLRGM